MTAQQEVWTQRLTEAWDSPDKNFILWSVGQEILEDNKGNTDDFILALTLWFNELQN